MEEGLTAPIDKLRKETGEAGGDPVYAPPERKGGHVKKVIFALALLFALSAQAIPAAACNIPEDPGISVC